MDIRLQSVGYPNFKSSLKCRLGLRGFLIILTLVQRMSHPGGYSVLDEV